ncbi:MAG: Gfo/Idh/MocA family oxidoreductase [Opitutaceae bacterium]
MNTLNQVNRREFLKKSTAAGLLLGAPSILKATTLNAPSDEIRIGFIGCGKQHQVLFDAMKNLPGIRFVAACDIMETDRLSATFNRIGGAFGYKINKYTDAETMLAKEAQNMDAVFITTPDFWHAPHTVMALEAGCHVYCEKMMSDTLEGARSMVNAMDRTGKLCQIGHQRRSNPRYLYVLNELIRKHEICGQIANINGQWNRCLAASQTIGLGRASRLPDARTLRKYGFDRGASKPLSEDELRKRFLNWRFFRGLSGGPISDLGAHQIDIFNWFTDSVPVSVSASGSYSVFKDREHFDNVMCIFDYETPKGKISAFYQVLTTTSAGGGYYESFMGTNGTIEISERSAYTNIYKESSAQNTNKWNDLVARGILKKGGGSNVPQASSSGSIASYESAPPDKYEMPGSLFKPPHQPHIENFFGAIRGKAKLNCDARHALQSEAPIYWVNPSADSKSVIQFTDEHLRV